MSTSSCSIVMTSTTHPWLPTWQKYTYQLPHTHSLIFTCSLCLMGSYFNCRSKQHQNNTVMCLVFLFFAFVSFSWNCVLDLSHKWQEMIMTELAVRVFVFSRHFNHFLSSVFKTYSKQQKIMTNRDKRPNTMSGGSETNKTILHNAAVCFCHPFRSYLSLWLDSC